MSIPYDPIYMYYELLLLSIATSYTSQTHEMLSHVCSRRHLLAIAKWHFLCYIDIIDTEYSYEDEKHRKRMDKSGIQQSLSKQS